MTPGRHKNAPARARGTRWPGCRRSSGGRPRSRRRRWRSGLPAGEDRVRRQRRRGPRSDLNRMRRVSESETSTPRCSDAESTALTAGGWAPTRRSPCTTRATPPTSFRVSGSRSSASAATGTASPPRSSPPSGPRRASTMTTWSRAHPWPTRRTRLSSSRSRTSSTRAVSSRRACVVAARAAPASGRARQQGQGPRPGRRRAAESAVAGRRHRLIRRGSRFVTPGLRVVRRRPG